MLTLGFYAYFSADQRTSVDVRHQNSAQEKKASAVDLAAELISKPQLKSEKADAKDVFKEYEKQTESLTLRELNEEVTKINIRLSDFSDMSFAQFSAVELDEFNRLSQMKAVFLKKLIFKKYANKKQMEKL